METFRLGKREREIANCGGSEREVQISRGKKLARQAQQAQGSVKKKAKRRKLCIIKYSINKHRVNRDTFNAKKEIERERELIKNIRRIMVLWEIALGTAYFLGLKRTYRHTLRIQRKIITTPNNHSNIGQFVHRRTRAVFDVAVKVHQNIQERDVQVGRNLGNFILQWLHQMKLSAQIRGGLLTGGASSSARMTKLAAGSGTSIHKTPSYYGLFKRGSNKNLLTSSSSIWPKPLPTIARMLRPLNPAGTTTHCRHLSIYAPDVLRSNYEVNWSGGVIRKDIMQWMMMQN